MFLSFLSKINKNIYIYKRTLQPVFSQQSGLLNLNLKYITHRLQIPEWLPLGNIRPPATLKDIGDFHDPPLLSNSEQLASDTPGWRTPLPPSPGSSYRPVPAEARHPQSQLQGPLPCSSWGTWKLLPTAPCASRFPLCGETSVAVS